jgi:hypothetical protein
MRNRGFQRRQMIFIRPTNFSKRGIRSVAMMNGISTGCAGRKLIWPPIILASARAAPFGKQICRQTNRWAGSSRPSPEERRLVRSGPLCSLLPAVTVREVEGEAAEIETDRGK